jgi:hypothetical protein
MVSRRAWAASALALALTALAAAAAVKLLRKPPAATQLAYHYGERRLVSGGKDVLVIRQREAYRIDASLHVTRLQWPGELVLDEVQSAAEKDGLLALTGKAHDHDPDKTFPVVLLADGAQLARIYRPGSDVIRAHVSNVLTAEPEEDEPKETRFAVYLQEDNAVYRMPFHSVGRDADDDRHPLEVGFRANSVERIAWQKGEGPLFLCATEYRHLDEKVAPVMPTVAIDVYGNDHESPPLRPLPLVLLGAEPAPPPPRVELTALASHLRPDAFVAAPLGSSWLFLGNDSGLDKDEVLVLDGAGHRQDRVARGESLLVITDEASPLWILIFALLVMGVLSLPVLVWRVYRAVASGKALFGTLHVPEGGALETSRRGHVDIKPGTSVRVAAEDVELGPGLRRADSLIGVPLIDGDAVFLFGQVQGDDAGPWRSSGRKRLVAEGRRHHIGRGTPADYAEQMTARANGRLIQVALAVVVGMVMLLLRFGPSL